MGLAGAYALGRAMQSTLFGTSAMSLPVLLAVESGPAGAALVACYVPARRASAVDPLMHCARSSSYWSAGFFFAASKAASASFTSCRAFASLRRRSGPRAAFAMARADAEDGHARRVGRGPSEELRRHPQQELVVREGE